MAFRFVIQVKTTADGALGGSDMESLLQSLYVENRAGFFFTKFCEHSGNEVDNCYFKPHFIPLLHFNVRKVEITQHLSNHM